MSTSSGGLSAYSRPDYGAVATPTSVAIAQSDRTTKLNQQLENQLQSQITAIRQRIQPQIAQATFGANQDESGEATQQVGSVLDVSV